MINCAWLINFYHFIDSLSSAAPSNSCIVTDAGSAFYVLGQALRVKKNQIFISSGSMGAMGFALPAANGAAASKSKKVRAVDDKTNAMIDMLQG